MQLAWSYLLPSPPPPSKVRMQVACHVQRDEYCHRNEAETHALLDWMKEAYGQLLPIEGTINENTSPMVGYVQGDYIDKDIYYHEGFHTQPFQEFRPQHGRQDRACTD